MTTISWDGRILAVDSRSSTPEQRPDTDTEPRLARICFHCERPAWSGSDNAQKLIVAPAVTWRGEKILAAAGTGSARDCDRLRRVMEYPPKGETELEKIWNNFTALAPRRAPGSTTELMDATMVVVTEQHLWVLIFLNTSLRSYLEPRAVPFAKGSGRDAAMLAMTIMGATAPNAVWAARAIDPATGGAVRWVDTTDMPEEGKRPSSKIHEEAAMSREEAGEYVRSGFKTRPANPEPIGVTATTGEATMPLDELDANAAAKIAATARASKVAPVKKAPAKKVATKTTTKKRSA